MTEPERPIYAPARLARDVAADLTASAHAADTAGDDWSQRLDALTAQARYSAGVLDGLSTILPAQADPAVGAHWTAPVRPGPDHDDTVRNMRAALDRILDHVGHQVHPAVERIAPDAVAAAVAARVDELKEKVGRAVHTGQQYAAKVDRIYIELDTARQRIAELEGRDAPQPDEQTHPAHQEDRS